VADKSNFTPSEWKLLLESMMMASIAITAAEPHGLWGLLKESFASGTDLAKARMNPGSNALVKALVADFGTAQGRSVARDGLKKNSRAAIQLISRPSASRRCDKPALWSIPRRRVMQRLSKAGYGRSASTLPRQLKRVGFWELEALPSVRPKKQRSPKFQAPST
jgi:hypothetical protein